MKFISSSIVKTGSSSLTDAVTYPTNRAIGGANVSLINDATGNGEFVFTALMPGTYKSVSSHPDSGLSRWPSDEMQRACDWKKSERSSGKS
jgi:hypothetical protein